MATPAQTKFVRGDGPAIAYQVVGEGKPDIFYVAQPTPPIDLIWEDPLLARGLRSLAAVGRLLLCDLRGWGSSDAVDPTDLPALQAWMDDIRRVMDAAGSERAVLIGQSEQALPVMLFAATYPERVDAMVLWSPFARYLRGDDYPCGVPPAAASRMAQVFADVIGTPFLAEYFAPSRADERGFVDWYCRSQRLAMRPANGAPVYARVYQPSDLRDVAATIIAPTLLIRRRDDQHVRTGHAQYLAGIMPNARLVELDGRDHLWWSGDTDAPIEEMVSFITGLGPQAIATDRQLATVLFTDIVDSTRLAHEAGDTEWQTRLARHNNIVERHVSAYRGHVVKFTGDGVMATFDGPARAIRCACDVRDALAVQGLQIRGGLHTGEVTISDDDVHGVTVNVAARVSARARPGEVLVSAAVAALVLGSRLKFEDRGTHELKGVPGTWQLLAAVT